MQNGLPIRGDVILASFNTLRLRSKEGQRLTISLLERDGMVLDSSHYYTLEDIERHFLALFGDRIAPALVEVVADYAYDQSGN